MRSASLARGLMTAVLFSMAAAMAQDAPGLKKGNAEFGVFGGGSLGLDSWRSTGGVNYSHAVHNDVLVYGEYNYLPGFSRSFTVPIPYPSRTINVQVPFRQPIHDVNAGIHYRLPIAESQFVPYLAAGLGVLRFPSVTARLEYMYDGITDRRSETFQGDSTAAANFGGGIRYYVTKHFAIRFEVKAYKGFNEPKYRDIKHYGLFMRSVVGLIYQFK